MILPVLDPRLSYEGLRADHSNDEELMEMLNRSKEDLQLHFDLYYAKTDDHDFSMSESAPAQPESPVKFNFFSRYSQQTAFGNALTNELAEYFRVTSVAEPFEGTDPLQWWFARREKFPNLYRLVRNVLCIPGI